MVTLQLQYPEVLMVKNSPAKAEDIETQVRSLGREIATHSSILA